VESQDKVVKARIEVETATQAGRLLGCRV